MPFQYRESDTAPAVGSISNLMLRRGDIAAQQAQQIAAAQARAAEVSGNAYAGAAQNIGSAVSGAIQQATDPRRQLETLQLGEQKKAISEADRFKAIIKNTPPANEDGVSLYDIPAIAKQMSAAGLDPAPVAQHLGPINDAFRQERAAKLSVVQRGAQAVIAGGNDPDLANHFLDQIEANGTFSKEEVAKYRQFMNADPANVAKVTAALAGPQKMERGAPGSVAVNPLTGAVVPGSQVPDRPLRPVVVAPGSIAVDPKTGETVATGPAKEPTPKSLQMKSVLVDGKPTEASYNPTDGSWQVGGQPVEASRIKPIPTQTSVTIQQGQSDAKSIADAIVSGDQPPDVKGLYRLAGPVRAELAKQGYDMTKANMDWEATKKHLSTLNGAQQTRLRQAISTASDSLGVIEDLAKQWDGGKFPMLNKVQLKAAINGAMGPKAQQIATNLQAQITDVTSELGNVYMGGNSPTDHALSLAQKNLSADWTRDQLLSAIKLARTNLQIRGNSITNSGAVLSGGPAAAPAGPVPTGRFNPATGKVEPLKPGGD